LATALKRTAETYPDRIFALVGSPVESLDVAVFDVAVTAREAQQLYDALVVGGLGHLAEAFG